MSWQQGFVVVAALMGLGLTEIARVLGCRAEGWVAWPIAVALPVALVTVHLADVRAHANTLVRDYGEAVLSSLPPRGVLLLSSDESIGSVRYLQQVEGLRSDVRVLPIGIVLPWFRTVARGHDDPERHAVARLPSRAIAPRSRRPPSTPAAPRRSPNSPTPSSVAVSGSASEAMPATEAGTSRSPAV